MRSTFSPNIVGLVRHINLAVPTFLVTYVFHAVVLSGIAIGLTSLSLYSGSVVGKLVAFAIGSVISILVLALAVVLFAKNVWQPVVLVSAEPPEIVAVSNLQDIGPTYRPGEAVIRPLVGKVLSAPADDQEILHEIEQVYSKDHFLVEVAAEFTFVFDTMIQIVARGGTEKVVQLIDLNFADSIRTVALRHTSHAIQQMENPQFALLVLSELDEWESDDGQSFYDYHGIGVRELSFKYLTVPEFAKAKSDQVVKVESAKGDISANAKWYGLSKREFSQLPFEVKRAVQVAREDRETTTNIGIPALQQVIEMFGPALLERFVTEKVVTMDEIQEALLNGDIDPDDLRDLT